MTNPINLNSNNSYTYSTFIKNSQINEASKPVVNIKQNIILAGIGAITGFGVSKFVCFKKDASTGTLHSGIFKKDTFGKKTLLVAKKMKIKERKPLLFILAFATLFLSAGIGKDIYKNKKQYNKA
jgi:hypothetical protein